MKFNNMAHTENEHNALERIQKIRVKAFAKAALTPVKSLALGKNYKIWHTQITQLHRILINTEYYNDKVQIFTLPFNFINKKVH